LATSNINGLVATQWILRRTSGSDTLTASAAGLDSALFTATALPAQASQIIAYSGNNSTTIAGGNRTIQAQALDQYNNPTSNTVINFLPVSSVSSASAVTNSSGLAQTVYFSPAATDSSLARAYITGQSDTAFFNIFGVQYVSNSLDPKVASASDTIAFSAWYANPGIDTVYLNPASSVFSVSDGFRTATATLNSPAFLAPRTDSTQLFFNDAPIPADFANGNYTPKVNLNGNSGGQAVSGVLLMDPGELPIAPLEILSLAIVDTTSPSKRFVQGYTIRWVNLSVRNNSLFQIDNLKGTLTFTPGIGDTAIADIANKTFLASRETAILRFAVPIPTGAPLGAISVDGSVSGNLALNGNYVFDNNAPATDSFEIISGAAISLVTYTPQTVSENQTVGFNVQINNAGTAGIVLNPAQTRLVFGAQNFNLAGSQVIASGSTSNLLFTPADLTLAAGPYQGILYLGGSENGAPFLDTLQTGLTDSLNVQRAALITQTYMQLSDSVVSQGQSGETLSLRVLNTGEAAARIALRDSIRFSYTSGYGLVLSSGQSFPLTINGGDSALFVYTITVDPAAVTGLDTFRTVIGYRDVNSGSDYQSFDALVYDSWRVQSGSSLSITALTATAAKVTQGQSGLPVTLEVTNNGETGAVITAGNIGLGFKNNNNTVNLLSPSLPDTLAAGVGRFYNFNVTVSPTAATGIDSLRGFVNGRNISTGATGSETSAYLDGWNVQTPADLVITRVYHPQSQVNSGQENLQVEVRLLNQGQATALLDSAGLYDNPAGNITDSLLLASLADSLPFNRRDTVLFNVDVSAVFTGALNVDGFVRYHDGNDLSRSFADSGAVNPLSWTVGTQSFLVVDSVFTPTAAMTLGQSGVVVKAAVRNGGSAPVQIDSLRMLFNGSPGHAVLSAVRTLPTNLPLLGAGQSFISEFNLSSASSPPDSGLVNLDLAAYGVDQIGGSVVSTVGSVQPDAILLQTPAVVRVLAILNPGSVLRGDNDVADTLIIRNHGGATARISDVTLQFKNGTTYYNRELVSPPLPFDLPGGTTDTVLLAVDVSTATPLGVDSLRGVIQGTEINRGTSVNYTSAYLSAWQVGGEGSVSLLRVSSARTQVSSGQSGIGVTVRISNQGSTVTRVDSLFLRFASGDTNYTVSGPVLGSGINVGAGVDTTFSLSVDVNGTALSGPDTVDARLVATEVLTGNPFEIDGAVNPHLWLVQDRPLVVMDSVTVTPKIASAGQTNLIGRVIITNQPGSYRASARMDSVDLNFLLSGSNVDTNFVITRITPPTLPFMLPAGQSQAINFDIDVNSNALDTSYTADGAISYVDINDNQRTGVGSALQADTLLIQSTADLTIVSLAIVPDTVSTGQDSVFATMVYTNSAGGPVQVNRAQLTTGTSGVTFTANLIGKTTPYTVNGYETDTLRYLITSTKSEFTGPTSVLVDGILSGIDLNSGQTTADTIQTSYYLQKPANLVWAGAIEPLVFDNDTTISFRVRVANTGEARILIDSTQTSLNLITTSYNSIFLSGA